MRYSGTIDEVAVTEDVRRRILDPAPGTALARARGFGIDLTLVLGAISLSPAERFARAEGIVATFEFFRNARPV